MKTSRSRKAAGSDLGRRKAELTAKQAIEDIVRNCGVPSRTALLTLPRKVILQLSRSAPERQRFELAQVLKGKRPFTIPTTVFDTTGYGEVASRLGRAGGYVNKATKLFLRLAATSKPSDEEQKELRAWTEWLLSYCGKLNHLIREAEHGRPKSADNSAKATRWRGFKCWDEVAPSMQAILGALSHASPFVEKCVRDVPRLGKRKQWPSRAQAHSYCVRLHGMMAGLLQIVDALDDAGNQRVPGSRRVRVATHAKPDVDALTAVWLVERYLFAGRRVDIVFLPYHHDFSKGPLVDCMLDMNGLHDPELLLFDHKPPAFADRNDACTAGLVWDYLVKSGQPVEHLADLVAVVHAGDSIRMRGGSPSYAESRKRGLHHEFYRKREPCPTDMDLYRDVRRWLDRHDTGK